MPWTIDYLEDSDVIRTTYREPLTFEDLQQVVAENVVESQRTGSIRFLGDCSTFTAQPFIADMFRLASTIDVAGFDRRSKEAMVVPDTPEMRKAFEFYGTVTTNRGMQVRIFHSTAEAMDWLVAGPTTP